MKRIVAILLAAGFLLACNQGSDHARDEHAKPLEEKHQDHENNSAGLVLNNGAKWKADSPTRVNVALLQDIASKSKQGSLNDYHQTAGRLQEGLNKMVKECKMQGPDHDALHKWLQPLVENTKELAKQTTAENAAVSLKKIEQQLGLFPQYFE